jgi:hypothetical protein
MTGSKRIVLAALTVLVFVSAIAIGAELSSRWYGKGEGKTTPPIPTPYQVVIYPFHEWLGDIIDKEFRGAWVDDNDYGEFWGKVTPISKTVSHCKGTWTWLGPFGHIKMGSFEMYFDFEKKTCEGKWLNVYNQDHGGIFGNRVE